MVASNQPSAAAPDWRDRLTRAIDHAAHLLPAQGPITVFIHHNTLHAFEHLPFEEAVRAGAETFGCQPYLPEARYRADLLRGRIRFDSLKAVVRDDLGERADQPVAGLGTRFELRLAMLQHPTAAGSAAELDYHLAETEALRRVAADVSAAARGRLVAETRRWVLRELRGRARGPGWAADLLSRHGARHIEGWAADTWEAVAVESLWHVCRDGVAGVAPPRPPDPPVRPAAWLAAAGADPDLPVHDLLIRYTAAFLDQGIAPWPLPDRAAGFYRCFLRLYSRPGYLADCRLTGLRAEADRLLAAALDPLDCIRESLDRLGATDWDAYLSATFLALPGWAGMIRQIEARGDRVAHPVPDGSLVEFLAVRLLLDRLAAANVAREVFGHTGPLVDLPRPAPPPSTAAQRAYPLFRLAQLLGWAPDELTRLTPAAWAELVGEVEGFPEVERRRVFHLAYERRLRVQTLDALSLFAPAPPPARPRFQAVTCLDEREESFRRHLEEVAPDCETFGAAGFFGVAMYYRGATDAHYVPLCPIVLTPGHWVEERPVDGHERRHATQARARRVIGATSRRFAAGTRSAAVGAVLTTGAGSLAVAPLVGRILFPRLAARVRTWVRRSVLAAPPSRLRLERSTADPGPANGAVGYTAAEMAAVAERLLRDIGLTGGFARLVFVLGHGSDSLNNPHKSAYDCGACGGSPGAANGRALAQMLNDPRTRRALAANGVAVPDDTWFVGGCHNTCDDSVTLADTDRVPPSHADDLARAMADLAAAGDRNAHERCRRFLSAPLDQTPVAARGHVQNRSEDLAQVRPELGHATNAVCVVGRRRRTRGLFLDRRAFLTSYDPTQDDAQGSTLARLLAAAVPVCGGINLEYYFSHVDSQGYGSGTKLPHNVTGLLGVMDGAASDLRTGLPWQMVEIHEPVRLLFVVETTPAVLLSIMDRNPVIGQHVRNGWVQTAVLDPHSGAVQLFRGGQFVPYRPLAATLPRAATSADWYRGWRDHLEFAVIGPEA